MLSDPKLSDLIHQAAGLLDRCRAHSIKLAAAESCTGGLLMVCLTEVPNSSDVVDRGFVTYSNAAKTDLLSIPPKLIERHGAVSEAVAHAMAEGALGNSDADIAVGVTGVAGPGGGSEEKPVGLVHIAAVHRNGKHQQIRCQFGDAGRAGVRYRAVEQAFKLIDSLI
jgi:nicotinamide-nucleotide amidase